MLGTRTDIRSLSTRWISPYGLFSKAECFSSLISQATCRSIRLSGLKALLPGYSQTEFGCDSLQPAVPSPQRHFRQDGGRKQVGIDEADATPTQVLRLDEEQDFIVTRPDGARQLVQQSEQLPAIPQITAGQLPKNERMHKNLPAVEEVHQLLVTATQVVDPDGGVHQSHDLAARRRGTGRSCGWLPPSFASRRALSRSISARRPSRTRAVFSSMPVIRCASASSSSSMFRVVRMIFSRLFIGCTYSIIK